VDLLRNIPRKSEEKITDKDSHRRDFSDFKIRIAQKHFSKKLHDVLVKHESISASFRLPQFTPFHVHRCMTCGKKIILIQTLLLPSLIISQLPFSLPPPPPPHLSLHPPVHSSPNF